MGCRCGFQHVVLYVVGLSKGVLSLQNLHVVSNKI